MNKAFLHIAFLFCYYFPLAQTNLIYNGDFELYSSCPLSESIPSQYPSYEIEKCLGWTAPTIGTSDYFNVCAIATNVSVPLNVLGFQNPYSGNGYCGGFFYEMTGGTGPDCGSCITWWEYIQGEFTQPLEAGRVYLISIQLSLAEQSEFALAGLGMYISADSIRNINTTQPFSVIPQIESPAGMYFADTVNWMEFSGYYLAIGGEQYITIGNFKDSITSDTFRVKKFNPPFPNTYYYVDGASSYDVTEEFEHPNVFSPNGDGINDFWMLNLKLTDARIHVYNRWGNEIRLLEKNELVWNGKNKQNENCNDGVYYYVIESPMLQKHNKLNKGFIQLVR